MGIIIWYPKIIHKLFWIIEKNIKYVKFSYPAYNTVAVGVREILTAVALHLFLHNEG